MITYNITTQHIEIKMKMIKMIMIKMIMKEGIWLGMVRVEYGIGGIGRA